MFLIFFLIAGGWARRFGAWSPFRFPGPTPDDGLAASKFLKINQRGVFIYLFYFS